MGLQDQIESFQKIIFSHFRHSANNECRISSLVPLVKESWGIYRFITSMLRAMHRSTLSALWWLIILLKFESAAQEQTALRRWSHYENALLLSTTVSANSIMNARISSI